MKKNTEQKNWLEWTVTIISGILVTFVLGFLIFKMVNEEKTPPDIVVQIGSISHKDGGFAVPITAFNKGSETAQNVMIEVSNGTSDHEKAEISFQYLPRNSSVNGWVIFSEKPLPDSLKSRIVGYSVP